MVENMRALWNFKPWGYHPGEEHFETDNRKPPYSDYKEPSFDIEEFYSLFPEFKPKDEDPNPPYTREFVESMAKQTAFFVKPTWCRELDGPDRHFAFLLTVAHISTLTKAELAKGAQGQPAGFGGASMMDSMPGFIASASVGGVSISKSSIYQPKSGWESWYYQTPYGRRFLVLLEQAAPCGLFYQGEENIADCLRW